MREPIDFYFDFTSPYGYFMSEKIDALAARFGRQVRWHPVLLGMVFKTTRTEPPVSVPLKGDYVKRDFARMARWLEVPFELPATFPIATQAAARTYYWLHDQDCALARRFAHAAFQALFRDGRDISAPATVVDIAAGLGVDAQALSAALQTDAVKARLKAENEAAMARGVFGAPYVIVDGEPFWGVDRLAQIERWLETGGF
ncbi:2-hydroxychromene-2-carboxylate isomerase [Nitrogeniibacter mangrovi]|uniref:2-hydroxychromene-2-carboxylate isomerase n=1 Tax=Nitrogeniibacter mangrovi TaxID=2016596 RepID=A0A6C1B0X3_9RHOO|nr:2-hydroxychromene-2-carboxylate isomerase [Nitrogeniibacter mangrovi]QID16555.1 2-hydroxychromene-2-carboxylate isomerase [Nitrogeniibacter mangrovi]